MLKLLVFLLMQKILAEAQPNAITSYGFLGVSLNQFILDGKRSDSGKDTTGGPQTTFINDKHVKTSSPYGEIFTGYIFRIENFGIGPEFFYNYGKLENKISSTYVHAGTATTAFDATYKFTSQMGANLKLGYFLNSYFLYTLLGFQRQQIQLRAKARQVDALGDLLQFDFKGKKKSLSTFSYGFGAQKVIGENYAVGIECRLAAFPRKNFSWTLDEPNNTNLTSSFKYQLRSVALKVMYVF